MCFASSSFNTLTSSVMFQKCRFRSFLSLVAAPQPRQHALKWFTPKRNAIRDHACLDTAHRTTPHRTTSRRTFLCAFLMRLFSFLRFCESFLKIHFQRCNLSVELINRVRQHFIGLRHTLRPLHIPSQPGHRGLQLGIGVRERSVVLLRCQNRSVQGFHITLEAFIAACDGLCFAPQGFYLLPGTVQCACELVLFGTQLIKFLCGGGGVEWFRGV